MNKLAILASYAVFVLSTALFMRRAGLPWLAAALASLFSPPVFMLLFAALILPLYLLRSVLGIPDQPLLISPLPRLVAGILVVGWCLVGFWLSGRFARDQKPPSSE
jgi:hypothetical protein